MTAQDEALVLTGTRVVVRPFRHQDITTQYLAWLNDPQVTRFSNQRFRHHDEASSRAYLASFSDTASRFLSVALLETGRAIGTMSIHMSAEHQTADLGIMIGARDCWGHGYGLECWSLVLRWLLNDVAVRKATAGTASVNRGMLSIMERSGMHHEATRRSQEIIEGQPVDILYYARFRDA